MAKFKSLKKKIRRLEARLQKGAKKLAKLKRKLEAASTARVAKTKAGSAAPAKKAGGVAKTSDNVQKTLQRSAIKAATKPAGAVKRPHVPAKEKRKLNLTPERRAQLAAAMKARWAAKRAAAATIGQESSSGPASSQGDTSSPQ